MTIIPTLSSLMPPSWLIYHSELDSPNVVMSDKRMIAVIMARGGWMISPKGSRWGQRQFQWAA